MRFSDWRDSLNRVTSLWRGTIAHALPERQILIRDHGRIRCFTLGTVHQLAIVSTVAGCVLWALLATAAYVEGSATIAAKDDEINRNVSELDDVKASYKAAFVRLDEFHAIFSGITCEVSDIQNSLLRIAEHNSAMTKPGIPSLAMPHLDPDASGCRNASPTSVIAATSPLGTPPDAKHQDTQHIVGSLKDSNEEAEAVRQRVDQLEAELAKLKASHDAFIQHSAGIAALRIGALEKALSTVGLNTKTISEPGEFDTAAPARYGKGGPFIAMIPGHPLVDKINPIALFNNRADRLDHLSSALQSMPLAAPLEDYEVTSPFGARNDPINAMTGIHEGIDLGAPYGTPVLSTGNGVVVWAGPRDRYGNLVEIDHGMSLHTRYAHLSKVLVKAGDKVQRGYPIGLLGDTGRSTGPHLHYEVRMGDQATNPMKFITAGQNVLQDQ